MSKLRPITNVVSLSTSAHAIHGATAVYVVNTSTTGRTITIANTISVPLGGGNYGTDVQTSQSQIYIAGATGHNVIIRKKSTDTLVVDAGTDLRATGVADPGT